MLKQEIDVKKLLILGGLKAKECDHCKSLAQSAYQSGNMDDFFEWSRKSQVYATQVAALAEAADIIQFMDHDEYIELVYSEK